MGIAFCNNNITDGIAMTSVNNKTHPFCQGTQKFTGASWTHQRGVRRRIYCTSCGKGVSASKWVVVAA
jgi:hypothetical protein